MKHNLIKTDSFYIANELNQECDVDITVHWSWRYFKLMYYIVFKDINAK